MHRRLAVESAWRGVIARTWACRTEDGSTQHPKLIGGVSKSLFRERALQGEKSLCDEGRRAGCNRSNHQSQRSFLRDLIKPSWWVLLGYTLPSEP